MDENEAKEWARKWLKAAKDWSQMPAYQKDPMGLANDLYISHLPFMPDELFPVVEAIKANPEYEPVMSQLEVQFPGTEWRFK